MSEQLTKAERLQRAKNKIQLMRRNIKNDKLQRQRMIELVRTYAMENPERTIQLLKTWIK